MAFEEFSKNYLSILIAMLFKHPLCYQQQEFSCYFNLEFKWFRLCYIIFWITSVILSQTFWCFQIIFVIFNWIIQWHCNIYIFCIICLSIIYFTYAVSEWCTFFKYCSLFLLSNRFAASSAPAPVIVVVPLTSIYA